jgi:hypothetical protein
MGDTRGGAPDHQKCCQNRKRSNHAENLRPYPAWKQRPAVGGLESAMGPDCSAGGFTCAAHFTIESADGLPILTTVAPQEYASNGDGYATGIDGGTTAMGIM